MVRFHLANLHPVKDKPFTIDEIWGDAEIGRKNVSIHRLKVQHDVHTLLIKGKIKNYPSLLNAEASLTGESSIHISNIKDEIPLPDVIKLNKGYAHVSFKGELKNKMVNGSIDVSLADFESNVAHAEQIIASLEFRNEILKLTKLKLTNKKEKLNLLAATEVYNFKTSKYLYQPINVHVENIEMTNALSILPSLNVLKGQLTGDLAFTYQNRDMEFKPKDGFLIHNLGLIVGKNDPFTILMIKRAKITTASFRVENLKEFQMDAMVELNHSLLDVHGKVNSKFVDFRVNDAIVDLEDFGNISNLDIKGKGSLDIEVSGPLEDTNINIKGKTKGFEVLGYRLGAADKDITIALGDSSVIIHRFEALFRNTPISGTGVINYDNKDIALGINSPRANFHDLKEILYPLFSKITFLPKDLDLNARIDANIFGKTSLDQLKLKTEVQFTDLLAYGETVSSGELSIGLHNQILTLNDLDATKGKAHIRGDFSFNLKNDYMKLDYEWDDLALSSIALVKRLKLNLQGMISGSLKGEGSTKDYVLKLQGKINDTQAQDYKFEDSLFDLNISPAYISGKASLLGTIVKSDFDYSFIRTRSSRINLDIDAPALKPFTSAFFGQHLESEDFSGSLKFHLDTQFRGNFEEIDLKANLLSLVFKHESFNVNHKSTQPQFLIEDNHIKKWNLAISEQDLFVQTKGSGTFGQQVDLVNEVHFNSKIFEVLLSQVLSAEGFIRNIVKIDGNKDNYQVSASSRSTDLNLTIEDVPFPLNHLSYNMDYSDDRLVIQELKTSLENGIVALKGDVFFDDANPDINIKFLLDKAEIPILGKSILNLSGEGLILGNEPPYNVGGEIIINKGQIINELNEFAPKSNALSQVRFLPPNQESPVGKLFNLNMNVKADTPVRISNSLMDVSLKGEVMLMGNPFRPKGEGHLFAPPGTSRIFFKNNEYFITNADLNFSPKKEISNPDFDVQAVTYIAAYKINAKAYGDLERFNFDLTSDPSLPRNSILSLIAFGYTDEIQNTLEQKDQQNLTQVGVGSFVFDRFKISDILNKQFGLQVNLGTVLEQSQTDSLLSGRTQEGQGQGGLGRTRSATKIELKKRLDEALSLSVSSTMGGSIGQRQSMNLNYSVSKKVQLEGVYELRTNAEGEEDIIDNSIGGDLKFRWTFK
ncbi:MAG: translocation/assembly module TamB domain-containing protein [Bdellovibrionales bacterium]|nr:translocation/assembly module TamB domain-containing protein [Bdellovibrionales bacterium]